jgi:hypothetical protein
MAEGQRLERGDKVVHPARPEWGVGTVHKALAITHQGATAQRLTVEFANKGRVVINTAIAQLTPKGTCVSMSSLETSTSSSPGGWLGALEKSKGQSNGKELWSLPDAMTDPFTSLTQRLEATLESFRFSTEPRSLIDWAVVQTGLDDPLSQYTRHDLEHAFPRFERDRSQHLKSLIETMKRKGNRQALIQAAARTRHAKARAALQRVLGH